MKKISRFLVALAIGAFALAACTSANQQEPPAPVQSGPEPARVDAVSVLKAPTDLPEPVGGREAQRVVVNLETIELTGQLADGTTYEYWTFNGTVPGPMIRVREGDTVELRLKNREDSSTLHSIDLHAVNGPGGGAVATQVLPGEEKAFSFKALHPGVYVYHCASPHIPTHIAMGMYGLIVVEPAEGLGLVDREFYLMQGEVYTEGDRTARGHLAFDADKLFHEMPNFVVFNGQVGGLTGDGAMKAKVGERIRLFIGNGGPNLISSFHVIGEIFDEVHPEGALEAARNVQTTVIPAGGATWVEFTVDVPGTYTLVDHAISRTDKGAVAQLVVEGESDPEIFDAPGADLHAH